MTLCPEGFVESIEGLAKLCTPDTRLYTRRNGVYEPAWAPVFYNPEMVENRDIAVGIVYHFSRSVQHEEFVVVDPLAATGVRGIRILLEAGNLERVKVFMGDLSDKCIDIMKINVRLNKLEDRVTIERIDANEYMYKLKRTGLRLGYIDIDPFGSPVPFTHSALSTARNGGAVAFTATDLAVLEGKYREKMLRRYGVSGVQTPISKDIAVRVLISYIARVAYSLDKYVDPVISYVHKHYARVYLGVYSSASRADEQMKTCLKTLRVCTRCGYVYAEHEVDKARNRCTLCESSTVEVGPLWVCKTVDGEVLENVTQILSSMSWILSTTKKLLKRMQGYVEVDGITKRLTLLARVLRTNVPPKSSVIQCLNDMGYKAVESVTYSDGIITTAPISDVVQCLKK